MVTRWQLYAGLLAILLLTACRPSQAPSTGSAPPLAPLPALATVSPSTSSELQRIVTNTAAQHESSIGVYVEHLTRHEAAALAPTSPFRAASLYKLFVLYATHVGLQRGELAADETITLSPEAAAEEPYAEWEPGAKTSVASALDLMITTSHNAAAAALIERLGGPTRINAEIRAAGLSESNITEQVAVTSARDVGQILKAIATDRGVNPTASRDMQRLLLGQEQRDRLPAPLPDGVEVAHKTGELPNLRHDAGIVYAPSGPYVFVALVDDAPSDAAAHWTIVELSRVVYEYFEGAAGPAE